MRPELAGAILPERIKSLFGSKESSPTLVHPSYFLLRLFGTEGDNLSDRIISGWRVSSGDN
jgi:hypothetical protein